MIITDIVIPVLSLVAVFLFGVQKFSKQIHQIGSERFKRILNTTTATRLRGLAVGMGFTSIIQSSTATTVILASVVGAGLLSFENSIAVILGANIGSTVTSQLVALNLPNIAPYIILAGFILMYFGRGYKGWGKPIFYFGLIFFSLALITLYLEPLRSNPEALSAFGALSSVYSAIFVGVVFTALIQSSGITAGLTIILVVSGLLNFEQALGIVIGANLGTTATALIASTVMGSGGRKVAVAHFLFNLVGIVLFLVFFGPFTSLVASLGGSVGQQVANAHVLFNVFLVMIFLLFLNPFYRAVNFLVK